MRKVIGILPLLVGVVAAPAQAQYVGYGPRAEVRAGYDELNVGVELTEGRFTERQAESDFSVGVEVGYDLRVLEGLVVGAYAGVDFSQIDGCDELFGDEANEIQDDEFCLEGGRNFTLGGRLGIPTGDGGLIYAKGGYSNSKIEASYTDFVDTVEESDSVDGWHVGGGFEIPVMGNVYVKGEYVHTSYGKIFSRNVGEDDFEIRGNRHQLLGGIGMRFGATPLPPPPPPPPPPPAPAAATKTCPDGSVVVATAPCPVPPPPPPPPPPPSPGERG